MLGASASGVVGLVEWALETEVGCKDAEADGRLAAAAVSPVQRTPSDSCAALSNAHPDLVSRALRWAVAYTNAREGVLNKGEKKNIRLRVATAHPLDIGAMHRFVTDLATFENEPLEVKTTPATFLRDGFGPARQFHCVFAEVENDHQSGPSAASRVSGASGASSESPPHPHQPNPHPHPHPHPHLHLPPHLHPHPHPHHPWDTHTPVAMALAHSTFSTWHGPAIYVEDVFVSYSYRRMGIGESLFRCWARTARAAQCTRLQWSVLDWNTPAVIMYDHKLKAEALRDWTLYRLNKDGIDRAADAD